MSKRILVPATYIFIPLDSRRVLLMQAKIKKKHLCTLKEIMQKTFRKQIIFCLQGLYWPKKNALCIICQKNKIDPGGSS